MSYSQGYLIYVSGWPLCTDDRQGLTESEECVSLVRGVSNGSKELIQKITPSAMVSHRPLQRSRGQGLITILWKTVKQQLFFWGNQNCSFPGLMQRMYWWWSEIFCLLVLTTDSLCSVLVCCTLQSMLLFLLFLLNTTQTELQWSLLCETICRTPCKDICTLALLTSATLAIATSCQT